MVFHAVTRSVALGSFGGGYRDHRLRRRRRWLGGSLAQRKRTRRLRRSDTPPQRFCVDGTTVQLTPMTLV
ncbi:hypothetical protein HSB1_05870 [Halogranum salarium B-1]|uniref:Uncharacterized protein n=1 Tax=Halogranum salarium B-1 TaxID=1210908 RepID=J3JI50_9EURY|nr:hypothetical protein HSB1_05870 [Halogranum salarium B-1]